MHIHIHIHIHRCIHTYIDTYRHTHTRTHTHTCTHAYIHVLNASWHQCLNCFDFLNVWGRRALPHSLSKGPHCFDNRISHMTASKPHGSQRSFGAHLRSQLLRQAWGFGSIGDKPEARCRPWRRLLLHGSPKTFRLCFATGFSALASTHSTCVFRTGQKSPNSAHGICGTLLCYTFGPMPMTKSADPAACSPCGRTPAVSGSPPIENTFTATSQCSSRST